MMVDLMMVDLMMVDLIDETKIYISVDDYLLRTQIKILKE